MSDSSIGAQLTAVLFVASRPVTPTELAAATNIPVEDVEHELELLMTQTSGNGIRLSMLSDKYQLVTAPAAAQAVRNFLQEETTSDLSKPALEALAIIAYRGPLTKAEIDSVRGVASDAMIRNLLARGLIMEAGKSSEAGRPTLYAISHGFLQHFGLTSPSELPAVPGPPSEN
jgi:segregation and condensation protein B